MNLSEKLTGRTSYHQYYSRFKMVFDRPVTKVSSLATLTIFTVIFFISFAILPTFKTIASLKREIADGKTVEAKLQQKIYSLNQAETLFGKISPDLNSLNQVLPPEPELERLAWQLHYLANNHQLTIASGSFDEAETDFIPVTLTLTGGYPNLKTFILDLNRIDRLVEVTEITIASKSIRSGSSTLTANLKLKAFYFTGI